jgi:NAD(P)-dependent dehydrogenase (short-subunit alcohol dehydrogenase family)
MTDQPERSLFELSGNAAIFDLKGRTAIVTGAGGGIGQGVAVALAQCGARVLAADLDRDAVASMSRQLADRGLRCEPHKVDVTRQADVDALVAAAAGGEDGGIDILVTSAGGFARVSGIEEITDEEWDRGLAVNMTGMFRCCRAVVPHMKRRGGGRIVTLSSATGRMPLNLTSVQYAAAKAGVIGFTRHLARELAPFNITVNAVAPGTTRTPRVNALYSAEHFARIGQLTPLGRVAEIDDQVGPILFLVSDLARYMTGTTLDVNGGKVML